MEDDLNDDEMPLCGSHPPKAKRRRLNNFECKTFQTTLKIAGAMKNKICTVEMSQSRLEIQVKIRQSHTHRKIEITSEIICDCAQQQLQYQKSAQTDIVVSSFRRLLNQMPDQHI